MTISYQAASAKKVPNEMSFTSMNYHLYVLEGYIHLHHSKFLSHLSELR